MELASSGWGEFERVIKGVEIALREAWRRMSGASLSHSIFGACVRVSCAMVHIHNCEVTCEAACRIAPVNSQCLSKMKFIDVPH